MTSDFVTESRLEIYLRNEDDWIEKENGHITAEEFGADKLFEDEFGFKLIAEDVRMVYLANTYSEKWRNIHLDVVFTQEFFDGIDQFSMDSIKVFMKYVTTIHEIDLDEDFGKVTYLEKQFIDQHRDQMKRNNLDLNSDDCKRSMKRLIDLFWVFHSYRRKVLTGKCKSDFNFLDEYILQGGHQKHLKEEYKECGVEYLAGSN